MKLLKLPAAVLLSCATAWGALALWFDGPSSCAAAGLLAAAFAGGCVLLLARLKPFRRGALAAAVAVLVVAAWWLRIPPGNDRDWQSDVSRLPTAEIRGSRVTIRNVRDFIYRSESDYIPRWETRTFDLDALKGADMFISYWGTRLIAHTIASWEFADGSHLAISIEARKERGEAYSAVRGFFRQYELYYVVAEERDVIGLRANFRGETVYLYRIRMAPGRARAILLDYLREANCLAARPRWYNAVTQNCTTSIRHHVRNVSPGNPWNWRILLNGYLDELGYMRGTIDTGMPFEELRRRSDITGKARAADQRPDFSARIREGLPGAHPATHAGSTG